MLVIEFVPSLTLYFLGAGRYFAGTLLDPLVATLTLLAHLNAIPVLACFLTLLAELLGGVTIPGSGPLFSVPSSDSVSS